MKKIKTDRNSKFWGNWIQQDDSKTIEMYTVDNKHSVSLCEKQGEWNGRLIFCDIKNRNELYSFRDGAVDRTWTGTVAHTPLKRARLPVPPWPLLK